MSNDLIKILSKLVGKKTIKVINLKEYNINNSADLNTFLKNNKHLEGGVLYQPEDHKLLLTEYVDARFYNIDFRGRIETNFKNGEYLMVGESSFYGKPLNIHINSLIDINNKKIERDNVEESVLRIVGVMNANVRLLHVTSVLIFADTSIKDDKKNRISSVSYTTFNMGKVDSLSIKGKQNDAWITECTFVKGRYQKIIIDGGYPPSELYFINPCVENAKIEIYKGERNKFISARDEGKEFSLFMGEETRYNYFESSYMPSNTMSYNVRNIKDYGIGNTFLNPITFLSKPQIIYDLIPNITFYNAEKSYLYIEDMKNQINKLDVTNGKIALKRYAKILNDIKLSKNIDRLTIESDDEENGLLMFDIKAFDRYGNVLEPKDKSDLKTYHFLCPGISFNEKTKMYGIGANTSNITICINSSEVDYYKFSLLSGAYENHDTVKYSDRIKIIMYENTKNFKEISLLKKMMINLKQF